VNFNSFSDKLKQFLTEFAVIGAEGHKDFKYVRQLVKIAHREQVTILDKFCIIYMFIIRPYRSHLYLSNTPLPLPKYGKHGLINGVTISEFET
jgi:hypothetical protein